PQGAIFAAIEGKDFTQKLATFHDPDDTDASEFSATIRWGDGAVTGGTVVGDGAGNFDVYGSHRYSMYSLYAISVQLCDHEDDYEEVIPQAAGAVAVVLPLGDHDTFHVVEDSDVSGATMVDEPPTTDYAYAVSGSGSFHFTFDEHYDEVYKEIF